MTKREREGLKRECRAALEEMLAAFQRGIRSLGFEVTRVHLALKMRDDLVEAVRRYNAGEVASQFSEEEVRERMVIAAEVVGDIVATAAD